MAALRPFQPAVVRACRYAAYLHARSTAGWKGRNAAILALVGLATLWFNFIGINYFSTTSQHSYAGSAPAIVSTR